ncbi:hypothetical protein AB4Z49_27840, partial [Cupriavidus sp. M-11]
MPQVNQSTRALARLASRAGTACLLAASLLLGGCAADKAYREGRDLAASGRQEEAMGKYQEAMILDPKDVQYRMGYMRAREQAVNSYVERAEREAASGKPDLADAIYRRALTLDRANERALAGLRAIDAARAKARGAAVAATEN